MTLRDQVENVDDANRSSPSQRSNFSQSTGNFNNNSDATTRRHTQRAQALQNIDLVDRNYALSNDLHDAQAQMAAIVAQNRLLQGQLSGSSGDPPAADADVPMGVDNEEAVLSIRGGGYPTRASPAESVLFYVDDALLLNTAVPTSCLPLLRGLAQGNGLSLLVLGNLRVSTASVVMSSCTRVNAAVHNVGGHTQSPSGFWPGHDNPASLSRFVSAHFRGDWLAYHPFAMWADS